MVGTNQGPTAFKLNYHRMEAYQTQSPLFRKSMSIYTDFKYAFLVNSAFRVEPFNTLHLTEFLLYLAFEMEIMKQYPEMGLTFLH